MKIENSRGQSGHLIAGLIVLLLLIQIGRAAEWETARGYRRLRAAPTPGGKAGFSLLSPSATGISFTNFLSKERFTTNQIYLNGSGVAAGDVDGDGWCDLYFCGLDGPNALYRNLGNWKFEDITASAGVACPDLDATGAVLADIDGDGDLDLIVNSVSGGTHIFVNDGKAHFTATAPLNEKRAGMSMALADFRGNGALDLYIGNYRGVTLRDQPKTSFRINVTNGVQTIGTVNGVPATSPELMGRFSVGPRGGIIEHGEPDAFYRNDGKGGFTPVSFTDGTFLDEDGKPSLMLYEWALSVMARDLNGDNAPDLYICNDFTSVDRIWINDSQGRFRAMPRLALRNTSKFSMGIDVADINRDGHDDLFVLDMLARDQVTRLTRADRIMEGRPFGGIEQRVQVTRNTLHLSRGDGTFAEIASLAGVDASDWSWTPIFMDVDLDGYEDLLICTGHSRDDMDFDVGMRLEAIKRGARMTPLEELALRKNTPDIARSKVAFRNRGDLTFQDVSAAWGFNDTGVSHGMALADLDNDGDLDVVINNLNAGAGIYRNESAAPRIAVRLKGLAPNTRGIGATINVRGAPVTQSQQMVCGGRYLSSDDAMRVFAAASPTNDHRIEVIWRSGKRMIVEPAQANWIYEIDEASAAMADAPPPTLHPPRPAQSHISHLKSQIFKDVSTLINHTHPEEPFNDFARQPLLANKLSQLGPGISWFDIDRDGWDDLIVGTGKGGQLGVFRNEGDGRFKLWNQPPFPQTVTRDQTGILGWRKSNGQAVVLAGSANYEDGLNLGSCVRQYDVAGQRMDDSLPGQESSSGPLALGDVDGNGTLELFVGGRVLGGKYPQAASSLLFRSVGDKWILDEANTKMLQGVGLVSGAIWADLDGDGFPELVMACEWGPLRVFHKEHGTLAHWNWPVTWVNRDSTRNPQPATLNDLTGWWNGVSVGDFDGDGKLDLIASNWGRNTRCERYRQRPLRVSFGDLDGNGTVEVIDAYYDPSMKKYVPWQALSPVAHALPLVQERFESHRAYAQAGVEDIFGDRLARAKTWEANFLDSAVFLNRGGKFVARALPIEAQFSPAYGISVVDFDGDGAEDIFLSQNFFGTSQEISEYDAGRGLLLKGNGKGDFAPLSSQESGIEVYGEQRGSAVADYDRDGKMDLVVAQNANQTKLYHNVSGKPGLRVRLIGPAGNPDGIGASIRLQFAQASGPVREIHAGSGYWSQDSATQIMATPQAPTGLWVRWPGGKTATLAVPRSAKEISVSIAGEIKVIR